MMEAVDLVGPSEEIPDGTESTNWSLQPTWTSLNIHRPAPPTQDTLKTPLTKQPNHPINLTGVR